MVSYINTNLPIDMLRPSIDHLGILPPTLLCVRYMAPELYRQEKYDQRADVYSFAMICYLLLEGVPPLYTMTPLEAAKAAATTELRPVFGPTNRNQEVRQSLVNDERQHYWL